MKNKSIFVTACCLLAFITSFAQNNASSSAQKIISSPAWLLRGNSGTDPSKNFIGTKDAQPLVFKANNQKAGYLDFSDTIQNTAFGYQALNANIVSDADYSTFLSAFGWGALSSNTTGWGNTAHGAGSLYANTIGDINNGLGVFSLSSNTTGTFNTAVGSFSLSGNTTGSFNTATGDYALAGNTTGQANIANGAAFTLSSNTEGSDNIATGVLTLNSNTTGNANIAYGNYSLNSNVTGNNNTALGYAADVAAENLNNAMAIGNGALVDASNKVQVGNTDVTSIGGQVGWTSFSDERIKDNVKENVPGLDFIKALRPVTYHFSIEKENALLGVKDVLAKDITLPEFKGTKVPGLKNIEMAALQNFSKKEIKTISGKGNSQIEKIQFTGFLAQDVDKAAKSINYDFSGIDKSGKIMGLRYSDFVVPLVKAVQELSKQNENLQKQIDELKAMINVSPKNNVTLNNSSLEQNIPNPFTNSSSIHYNIPAGTKDAQLIITDNSGKTIKQFNLNAGTGVVNIDASSLRNGTYSYTLLIDGKQTESRKMIKAN